MKRTIHLNFVIRIALFAAGLLCAALACAPAWSAEPVRIGVLAVRTIPQSRAKWHPLAVALKQAIPERDFAVEAMTMPELEAGIASRQLDFVLTNPGHYLKLMRRGLSAPLATVLADENGRSSAVYGGVIFRRSGLSHGKALSDIAGKSVAIVSENSLGGYQMQAYELKRAGIDLSRMAWLTSSGESHDEVVSAVLAGRAEIGFVRTGVLEALVREGQLDWTEIEVLNRQNRPDFPAQISTLVYPEWPFSSLAHTDENLARRVAAALFLLNENTRATHAMGIGGFAVPADYTPVADLLRALRLPPFEAAPVFTLRDVWTRYWWYVVGACLAFGLILILGARLLMARRRLAAQYRLVLAQKRQLRESEFRWKFALEGSGDGLWDWNVADGTVFFSPQCKQMLGLAAYEMGDRLQEWEARMHPEDRAGSRDALNAYLDGKTPVYATEYRMRCTDGSYKWIFDRALVVSRSDTGKPLRVIGTRTDITSRKLAEENLMLAASVFTHALEGIMITDAQGVIIDVNQAFTRITGYDRAEVLGRNPHVLNSGRQSPEFYVDMWRDLQERGSWYGEIWNRRKNGEVYAQLQNLSAVRGPQGQTRQYISLFSDITELKAHQQELHHLAHFDVLTDLPNRLLLADRLQQGMAQTHRRRQMLALVFVDLDGFKRVNDRHGHEVGDHLLLTLATRMKLTLREGDTLARLGGDEFVAVILDLTDASSCRPMLARLLAAAAEPVQFGDILMQVSASLGVAFYPQAQELEADQLLRQADQAMYQAKAAGKNRYHVFDAA